MLFITAVVRAVLYGLYPQRFVHHIYMMINMIYLQATREEDLRMRND